MVSRAHQNLLSSLPERRAFRRLPFETEVVVLRSGGQPEQSLSAWLADLTPAGATVGLSAGSLVPGEKIVLGVSAANCPLLDIAAEVLHVEFDADGRCRAGCEFRPLLPRRQYLVLRRLASPVGTSGR